MEKERWLKLMKANSGKENTTAERVKGQWVFGGGERGTGRTFLVVLDRTTRTIRAIVKEWILRGTTVAGDHWLTYRALEEEGYSHDSKSFNIVRESRNGSQHKLH